MNKLLKPKSALLIAALLIAASGSLSAQNKAIGPRSLGMGGVGVATANDYNAAFLNPAAIHLFEKGDHNPETEILDYKNFGFGMDFSGGYSFEGNLEDYVDDLADLADKLDSINSEALTSDNIIDLLDAVSLLDRINEPGNAFLVDGNGGFATRIGKVGIGIRVHAEGFGRVQEIDYTNIGLDFNDTRELMEELFQINSDSLPTTFATGDRVGAAQAPSDYLTTFEAEYDPDIYTKISEPQFNRILEGLNKGIITPEDIANDQNIDVGDISKLTQEEFEEGLKEVNDQLVIAIEEDRISEEDLDSAIDGFVALAEKIKETDTANSGSTDSNKSAIAMRGFGYVEVPLTFGKSFGDNFSMGANLKYMRGRVYGVSVGVFDDDSDEIIKRIEDNFVESNAYGLDIGALYRAKRYQLGVNGTNLNSPKFDGLTYVSKLSGNDVVIPAVTIDPQITAGAAVFLSKSFMVEYNVDLMETESFNGLRKSQYSKLGAQWHFLKIFVLRGGYYTNLAESLNGDVLSAGLGVRLAGVRLDFGGSMSTDTKEVDGSEVPLESRFGASLSFRY